MTGLLLLLTVALVLLNGLFVAAEFALVRTRRARVETQASEGSRAAARVVEQIGQIDAYLSACQLGITMASLGLGAVGEPVLSRLMEPVLGGFLSHGVAIAIAGTVAFALITTAHITVGEQAPKMLAITRTDRTARAVSLPLNWFKMAFGPVIAALNTIANSVVRVAGVRPDRDLTESASSEDIKVLIAYGMTSGGLDPGEATMLSGVFNMHEQQARQVMTPIPAVVTADTSEGVKAALERCISSGHTRLPVTEDENQDRIKGVVHTNRLSRLLMKEGPDASIEPIVRPAPIVPESRPLDDLLADLQRERSAMAVVVDEFGRTVGVVTVEDIVEEVVGEIIDETDPASAIRKLTSGDWYVRGHISLDDLADVGVELPADSEVYTSVGGFVFDQLGRLPKRGDVVQANGFSIRVESVRENRVEAVRIRRTAV